MKRTEPRNPDEIDHFRKRVKAVMDERRLSEGELAAKAIIPLSSLLRVLDKTIKNPGLDVTLSLAKALGVTVSELVGDTVMNKGHTTFYIEGRDRTGLLHDITEVIKPYGLNIASSISTGIGQVARCVIHVEGIKTAQLQNIREQILGIPWVNSVQTGEEQTESPTAVVSKTK